MTCVRALIMLEIVKELRKTINKEESLTHRNLTKNQTIIWCMLRCLYAGIEWCGD